MLIIDWYLAKERNGKPELLRKKGGWVSDVQRSMRVDVNEKAGILEDCDSDG